MKSKAVEWGIAAFLLVLALIFSVFRVGKAEEEAGPEQQAEPEQEDAEDARRRVMAEMGSRGGKKSKRGPAKKKEEQSNEVQP